jgi:ELWxxDGT repeat protein
VIKYAYAQQQITDFPSIHNEKGSAPSDFVEFNNRMFFEASSGNFDREIWTLSENQSEATLLKDIFPGDNSRIANLSKTSVVLNNKLYFAANDGINGVELWKSDGTLQGTELVRDILSVSLSSSPTNIVVAADEIFLFAETENDGRQIWKIDQAPVQSLSDKDLEMLISVYPNPGKNMINIRTEGKITYLHIFNNQGQIIAYKDVVNNHVDISELNSGLYMIEFDVNGQRVVRKFIKE